MKDSLSVVWHIGTCKQNLTTVSREGFMKSLAFVLFLFTFFAGGAQQTFAQAKGIDTQNKQIKDIGTSQGPANNGNRRDVGAGRGIDFGGGRTPDRLPLPNPYRLASKRDLLVASITDVLRERNLVVDEAASRPADGVLVTQPYTFAKGAVTSQSQLLQFASLPDQDRRDGVWTRGRYTLTIDVQTIDGINNNVSVTAKVEGRTETALGSQWLTLTSSGQAENEVLAALVERITGTAPYQETKQPDKSSDKQPAKSSEKNDKPQR